MFQGGYYEDNDPMDGVFHPGLMRRAGHAARRFDEYYRCYPVAMMPGPEREAANHGGKVFMPASALDKLTRLHITYPMLFEVHNGAKQRMTHAGVLEFIAEEGKIYLPFWGDVFTFSYNDQTYEMAVLETKPENPENAISVLETDLEVDFAPPLGYEEPKRPSGTSTPSSMTSAGLPLGGMLHPHGTMAQSINYAAIAPESTDAARGAKAVSSNFLHGGQRLNAKKGSKQPTPKASTPVSGVSTNAQPPAPVRRTNGPQPLRLPPGKLFFGYAIKPVQKSNENGQKEGEKHTSFLGAGQSLRGSKKK
ncbi:ubiquitin fusion degradation protein [Coccidioides immitis RMSCC 3703]|uniref:Ubiquitin fusion degradation protein n=1 Tax=Coccidioides immitis RMSCC 3703 TaxID=454286 RepID=A0A0J8QN86_COCIT|nr:ubiquitin fusion degradation protein [Coccidioides immitis RMSCC 3703]